ncbi:hypothetical protein OXIME_001618 [Oxyplasma meridianum]|uniref:C4-dicarboxylate ABC transporter n=1 Tax=Oxyplasma meridianum TaxID=3073602 RepID=A0AAX4NIH9_9ARCH
MQKLSGLQPQWFSLVIGTLSISLVLYVLSLAFSIPFLFTLGKYVFIAVLVIFWIVFILWIYRYILSPPNLKNDLSQPETLSFTALLGVLFYAGAFFYITYFAPDSTTLVIILYLYFIVYCFIMAVNIVLNYMVYTGKVKIEDVNYVFIIPSIVMGASVILSSVLIPSPYFSGNKGILTDIYITTLLGFAVSVFQFIFYGSAVFVSFMMGRKKTYSMPTTMMPLGAVSMFVINLMLIPTFNSLKIFYFPKPFAETLSIALWGVEILYFFVGSAVLFSGIGKIRSLSVWAYVFPVGISVFSDFLLWDFLGYYVFKIVIVAISVIILLYYIYAMSVTMGMMFSKEITRSGSGK